MLMYVQIQNYLTIHSGKENIFPLGHHHKCIVRLKMMDNSSVPKYLKLPCFTKTKEALRSDNI